MPYQRTLKDDPTNETGRPKDHTTPPISIKRKVPSNPGIDMMIVSLRNIHAYFEVLLKKKKTDFEVFLTKTK